METVEKLDVEIDIEDHAKRGVDVPHAKRYRVRIDDEFILVDAVHPTGEHLLSRVGKRPCAYELIAEFACHQENEVIDPTEGINLRNPGLKGFITAHKEIVTISINGAPYPIERGCHSVADILKEVNQTTDGYDLLQEKDGPPMPIPAVTPLEIHGCEVFHTQVHKGGSS